MRKDIEKKISQVNNLYVKFDVARSELEDMVIEVCQFDSYIEFLHGDRVVVGNTENNSVAFISCLEGKTKTNKLSREEHKKHCI